MNTKTMRLPPRRFLTSNKRKECEGFNPLKSCPPPNLAPSAKPVVAAPPKAKPNPDPVPSNQLLAGYLAHEYLTKRTLFGQKWDPARPEAAEPNKKIKLSKEAEPDKESYDRYVEVSNLLKGGEGVQLPGVFNPTQLARLLQM